MGTIRRIVIILIISLLNVSLVLGESGFVSFVILNPPEENKTTINNELTSYQKEIIETSADKQTRTDKITGMVVSLESEENQSMIYILLLIVIILVSLILFLLLKRKRSS